MGSAVSVLQPASIAIEQNSSWAYRFNVIVPWAGGGMVAMILHGSAAEPNLEGGAGVLSSMIKAPSARPLLR
jgi:hypothetical protein